MKKKSVFIALMAVKINQKKLMCILHSILQVLQMSVLDVEMHLQCCAQDSWLTATASAGDRKPFANVKEVWNLLLLKCSSNPTRNGPWNNNPA